MIFPTSHPHRIMEDNYSISMSKNGNNEVSVFFFLFPLDIALEIADQLDDFSLLRVSIANNQNIFGKEAVVIIESRFLFVIRMRKYDRLFTLLMNS